MSDESKVYGPRFAILPDDVLFADVSATAKLLWAILARYADPHGNCYPGRKKLAEVLGCSMATITRVKAELVKAKLVECHERYTEDGRRTSDDVFLIRGGFTGDQGGVHQGSPPTQKCAVPPTQKCVGIELDPEGSNPTTHVVGSGVTSVSAPPLIKIAPPCFECLGRPGVLLIEAKVDSRTFESSDGRLVCTECYAQALPDEYEAIREPLTDEDRQRGHDRIRAIRDELFGGEQ